MTAIGIAVLIPVRNARHRLWRSLASLAAQSLPPAQVLVLDEGSTDGLADWLRLRWPGVELWPAGGEPCRALATALAGITAPVVALMEPGDRWPGSHLATLAAAWAESDAEVMMVPATGLERTVDGRLEARQHLPAEGIGHDTMPLGALSAAVGRLRTPAPDKASTSLVGEIRARLRRAVRIGKAVTAGAVLVSAGEPEPGGGVTDLMAWTDLLDERTAGLPSASGAVVVGLEAASRPSGLLDLLGMALTAGAGGRRLQATTLADLTWTALRAVPEGAPIVVTTPAPLDLRHAGDQLCMEELVRRSGKRPVRLAVRSLLPSSPTLLSRLIETVTGHPDLELWVNDAVGYRYAVSLLGRSHVRLTPPPLMALANSLRHMTERQLLLPEMLGGDAPGPDLAARLADLALWPEGLNVDAARRLGPALARVLGLSPVLRSTLLQQAWAMTLLGWAAARSASEPLRTGDLDTALFAAMCGRIVHLEPDDGKVRDFAATWPGVLTTLGVTVAEATRAA
ncbi:glycosyltransferase family 2 protein [Benzoatithermus flavus]|uniref:Glycosyltransferase family A protein n=1 Tax=Benzoatithermus flavus TaxID=3108223 RepID=A0ABU8XWQ3_9PROT